MGSAQPVLNDSEYVSLQGYTKQKLMQLHALHDAKIVPNKKFMSIKEKDQRTSSR
jgi:hypothetical protein